MKRRNGKPIVRAQILDMRLSAVVARILDDIADMRGTDSGVVYACDLLAVLKAAGGAGTMFARKPFPEERRDSQ